MTQLQDTLDDLLDLQELDTELARQKRAQTSLDNGQNAQAEAARLRGEHEKQNALYHKLAGQLKDCELQLQGIETKIKGDKDKLYKGLVSNPKDMMNIEREIASLGRQRSDLDEKILDLMDQTDRQRTLTATADAQARVAEECHATSIGEFRSKYDAIKGELEGLTRRRSELATCIGDNPLLKRYEDIRAKHAGVGIARVKGSTCGGCGMPVASTVVKAVRDGEVPATCENCARLLAIS